MEEKKDVTRREFLGWAAAAAALAILPGCGETRLAEVSPGRVRRTTNGAYASAYGQPSVVTQTPSPRYIVVQQQPAAAPAAHAPATPQPQPLRRPSAAPARTPAPSAGTLRAVSRQSWATVAANPGKMKAMNGVTRITIHHEGSKANNDTTPAQVAATLQRIQGQHKKRMGAGDIGYHFIIDRTGRIWQGRDSVYQGAHTSGANSHNIGVMLLGNFEIQQPTGEQLSSMRSLVLSLARLHGLNPRTDVRGHSDFGNTQCPGKNLKPHVKAFAQM